MTIENLELVETITSDADKVGYVTNKISAEIFSTHLSTSNNGFYLNANGAYGYNAFSIVTNSEHKKTEIISGAEFLAEPEKFILGHTTELKKGPFELKIRNTAIGNTDFMGRGTDLPPVYTDIVVRGISAGCLKKVLKN